MAAYESSDEHVGSLWIVVAGLVIVIVLALAGSRFLVRHLDTPRYPELQIETPEAGLSPQPTERLEQYRAQKQQLMTSFAWVDRDNGIARIPIDTAMDLMLELVDQDDSAAKSDSTAP